MERAPGASAASEGSAPSVLDGVPEVSGMLPRVLRVGWMTSWCRWWPRRAHRGSIRDLSCSGRRRLADRVRDWERSARWAGLT